MKVLHAAFMSHSEPGILRQMSWENQAAKDLALPWHARLYTPAADLHDEQGIVVTGGFTATTTGGMIGRAKRWLALRKGYYKWLSEASVDYDILLLRHTTCDPFRGGFIKRSPIPVLSVHHSLEVPELASRPGLGAWLRSILEERLGEASIGAAAGIISVTEEIRDYELSRVGARRFSYVYPNGIAWVASGAKKNDVVAADVPQILFVASTFVPWHGLDLLLDDIESCKEKFVLHLVGSLVGPDEARARSDPRIVVHGLMNLDELKALYRKCSIGLTSFALDRKGMREACTLKVREYLSMGLPVYSGHGDVFPEDFRFYRKGKVAMREILQFERSVRGESRYIVSEESRPFIDKKCLLESLYRALEARFCHHKVD